MTSNENISVIILAAGKGSRMKSGVHKVMHKVSGITLIEHLIKTAKAVSDNIISVISPEMDEVKNLIEKSSRVCFQKDRLGTGHAVKQALENVPQAEGKVVILYGDTPLVKVETISKMLALLDDKTGVCVLGFKANDPTGYGRLIISNNDNLEKIVEHNDASEQEKNVTICNSGVMVFNQKYIHQIINKIENNNSKKEYYLTDAIQIAKDMDIKTKVIITDESEVIGINSQKERAFAEKIRQDQLRDMHMDNGVIITAPETIFFSEDTSIAAGTVIEPYVVFKGVVEIKGKCVINSFSQLEDCEVGEDVVVGPYARIRPGTKISASAKIGNFVEIKSSTIGKNSKVNHLSYIGDTEMGDDVNIGAGTITCNYDGKNKFKTKIEQGAFVGSNSSLVAPVNIGKKAVIGAGTTLFRDAPAEKITVNEKKLISFDKKE